MSTATEPKPFDPIAYNKQANESDKAIREGKEPPAVVENVETKPKVSEKPKEDAEPGPKQTYVNRRERKLLRTVGALEGKVSMLESLLTKGAPSAAAEVIEGQPEEKPAESKATSGMTEADQAAYWQRVSESEEQAAKDIEEIEWPQPYADVAKKAEKEFADLNLDGRDALFFGLRLKESKRRIPLLYHLTLNPELVDDILDLPDSMAQDRFISALEGEVKVLYSKRKAAGASEPEKAQEERLHPADSAEADGRTPPERREAPKPRPSTEVAPPRGGSPPPDKPKPGDPAWLAYRNAQTGGR